MKYRYTSFFPPDESLKWMKRPMVQIEVSGPAGSRKFDALIDSGADISLFNTQVAELLGFDLSKAKSRNFLGISGGIKAHALEDIEIKIEGMDKSIKIPVSFVASSSVGLLLGQEGFFDQYQIKFEKDHDTFEIVSIHK
ncbi:MAG: aspartyl protease family protein [bacterium]|nr:aspartyl protease family protein [bacterium]